MIRGSATVLVFVSALFFPWPLTAFLALMVALFEPWVPFAVGLFVDTLYYVPHAGTWPIATFVGVLATVSAFLVRSWLKTSIIGR